LTAHHVWLKIIVNFEPGDAIVDLPMLMEISWRRKIRNSEFALGLRINVMVLSWSRQDDIFQSALPVTIFEHAPIF
jgi:hypothetical protein